jgi:hypothetical protein
MGKSRKEASPAKTKIIRSQPRDFKAQVTKNHEAGGVTGGSFLGESGSDLVNKLYAFSVNTGRVESGVLVTPPTPDGEE